MVYHQNQLDLYPHKEEVERSYFFKFEFKSRHRFRSRSLDDINQQITDHRPGF